MQAVQELDWQPDLFGGVHDVSTKVEQRAPLVVKKVPKEMQCSCNCGLSHNNAVSKLVGVPPERRILWFRSMSCKTAWEKTNAV
jgi:hypothetical protein